MRVQPQLTNKPACRQRVLGAHSITRLFARHLVHQYHSGLTGWSSILDQKTCAPPISPSQDRLWRVYSRS
ncbi:Uncharacterized protein TCM_012681 [Theobroma cacao]|uniref:Uncharacterized protein n=1 Tax=Theobroma cacao TaxID=3641 RepID=A0A061FW09_THECC|nr:Uncharacterized protein TCM_012681 [Theobroma cacao]